MREFSGISLRVQGHLRILEYADAESYARRVPSRTLLNRRNAIHKDHAAILVANALAHRSNCNITYMVFGNGGTTLDTTGTVSFKAPNDTGLNPDLYNTTFFQMVDDQRGALPGNQMGVRHIGGSLFADMDIRCLIDQNQPFGQLSTNTLGAITEATTWGAFHTKFAFDEIGLKTADGTLITHVVFTPVIKTASSLLEVIYTIRVAIPAAPGAVLPTDVGAILFGLQATAQVGTTTAGGSGLPSLLLNTFSGGFSGGVEATAQTGVPTLSVPQLLGCGHPVGDHIIRSNLSQTVQGGNVVGRELAQTCSTSSGRFYFEVTMDSGASGDQCGIGLALPSATETDIGTLWTGGVGYRTNGTTFANGLPLDILLPTISPGQTLGIAVDTVIRRIWFGINFTVTPASTGGFGPSVNFGGKSFSSIVSTFFDLTIEFPPNTSDQFTYSDGSGGFVFAPPVGFGYGWGGTIPNEGSYSTWDVVNSVNVNFFSDNFAAQGNALSNGVRTTNSYSTGKRYFEFSTSQLVWNGGWAAIIDSIQSVTAGLTAHAVGISNIGSPNGQVHNDTYGQVAVDMTAKLLWIRGQNGDNWNNNALANPATGVGGLSIAALTPPYYFGISAGGPDTQSYIIISNPAYFYYAAPVGFTPGF